MLEKVEIIFYLFILFYILVILYDLYILLGKKITNKKSEIREKKLLSLLENRENKKIIEEEKNKIEDEIYRLFKKLDYLELFNSFVINNKKIGKKTINNYIEGYAKIFSRLSDYYIKKDSLEKAYFAFTIEVIGLDSDKINVFLFEALQDKSIYTIDNALHAIYKESDCKKVVKAFLTISKYNVSYNNKLIADGLLNYKGDKEELSKNLLKNFDKFNSELKVGFINYFKRVKFECRKELMDIISNRREDKEVIISSIRYFQTVKYNKIVPLLINLLENNTFNDFEYDVVINNTLGFYNTDNVKKILKKQLCSSNYFIRKNAALSLNKLMDLKTIDNISDKYAREMIDYICKRRG